MRNFWSDTERFIDKAFDIIVVLVLIVGVYYAVDAFLLFNDADSVGVTAYRPTENNPESYKEISEDCIGWITLYNTKIDYPVMQGTDNVKYLDKDPFGAYSLSGSIYLDSRNDVKFGDRYSLIYGHHVEGGRMFGGLDKYESEEYMLSHREGELIYDGKYHKIEAFAFAHTDASEGMLFNPVIEGDRMDWINANADLKMQKNGDRIVALSTCKTPTSTLRTIVFVSIVD